MRLPNAESARVEREKITDYLLSTTNQRGRNKAVFFLSFGFSTDHWQGFAEALRLQATDLEVVKVVETVHGLRYHVDGVLETPDGRNPQVKTVWQMDVGSDFPRLITAYPQRR
jgi:hypothetical protein